MPATNVLIYLQMSVGLGLVIIFVYCIFLLTRARLFVLGLAFVFFEYFPFVEFGYYYQCSRLLTMCQVGHKTAHSLCHCLFGIRKSVHLVETPSLTLMKITDSTVKFYTDVIVDVKYFLMAAVRVRITAGAGKDS